MLRKELMQMQKGSKISAGLKNAYHCIISGDNEGGSLQTVKEAANQLKAVSLQDEQAEEMAGTCENIYFELEELAYQINRQIEKNDFDPVRMEQVENRLDQIHRLEKKFGSNADEIIQPKDARMACTWKSSPSLANQEYLILELGLLLLFNV